MIALETMTHTQRRCRHSQYEDRSHKRVCICTKYNKECTWDECRTCDGWQPPYVASLFFAGGLDPERAKTLTEIYQARQKRGEW